MANDQHMGHRYIPADRDQSFLLASSFRDLLGEDHLVWTVIDVVDQLDISAVEARYGDHDRGGRPAFDPRMMLALMVYAYCIGLRSSRRIERACRTDWAFRAICANLEPDHATIARFRASLDGLLAPLFAQVLAICADLGMGQVGIVAVDGTKMEAAAALRRNRTAERLAALEAEAEAMLREAEAVDAEEDAGSPGVGPVRRESDRRRRLETIRAAAARVAEQTRAWPASPPRPRPEPPTASPAPAGPDQAEEPPTPQRPRRRPGPPVANTTDPDSAVMKAPRGFVQGYNAQAVASADQLVLAAEVTRAATDAHQLDPMLRTTLANLAAAAIDSPVGVALADAGYWSEANSGLDLGFELLIATTKARKQPRVVDHEPEPPSLAERTAARLPVLEEVLAGTLSRAQAAERLGLSYSHTAQLVICYRRHGEDGVVLRHQPNGTRGRRPPPSSATLARRAMEAKLADEDNRALYAQRSWLIEGVFAHIKDSRNFRRFLRRGLEACDAEWKLIHLTGNLLKVHQRRRLAGPAPCPRPTGVYWRPHGAPFMTHRNLGCRRRARERR